MMQVHHSEQVCLYLMGPEGRQSPFGALTHGLLRPCW